MGIGRRVEGLLPQSWAAAARPKWHLLQMVQRLRRQGGSIVWDRELSCWTATKRIGSQVMTLSIGSYRDLRRVVTFDRVPSDNVFPWLEMISDCTMLYDFGPSGGLESLTANAHHNCEAVMVELYTPSVLAILRGITLAARSGRDSEKMHPMIAGGDREPGFGRISLHQPPVFGGTSNTFEDVSAYARGGRADLPVFAHQWAPAVSIDSLHGNMPFKPPTHVKIDVDGFEGRIMEGATDTLKSRVVRSWSIEISPGNFDSILKLMSSHGYVVVDRFEHYPGKNDCWDYIFAREDLAADYSARLALAKARHETRVAGEPGLQTSRRNT